MSKNSIPATEIGWLGDEVDGPPASGQVKESSTLGRILGAYSLPNQLKGKAYMVGM